MRVFKFGGASIATPERVRALVPIISNEPESVVVVISALGKTTNALEQILDHACAGRREDALHLARLLQQEHLDYAAQLLNNDTYTATVHILKPFFNMLEKAVHDADPSAYDRSYDAIVCMGELFSTRIISCFMAQEGMRTDWVNAQFLIRTDDTFRDGNVDWDWSQKEVRSVIGDRLNKGISVITQGFIGATAGGQPVTLGREGSDYTAAILAAMLQLESVTIWKDVEGLKNADPKLFPGTVMIDAITYNEVIEMAFYGAQIIHPKTIKPLQNNNIPLFVKCFLDPSLPGTVIRSDVDDARYPPLIVRKDNQVLFQVTTRDFSFITESNLSSLYAVFHELKVKINLIQNAAISFVACIDNRPEKISQLRGHLEPDYKVLLNDDVSLLTVRHFNQQIVDELTAGRQLLLKQETRKTLQVVMKQVL